MKREKNIEEELIELIVNRISSMDLTKEEKNNYTKKILRYIRLKIDYYQIMGIDISLSTLIIGMGIGTTVADNDNPYLPFILGGLGVTSLVVTSIKRKIKYKDVINNFVKKETRIIIKK